MARTPLLRAIQRLAEEHRTADRLGIPPDELRGRRSEAAYTRGDFLKRAGVAGAAVAVAGPAAFARPSGSSWRSQQRIAIVGGGIAGLSAALTLADAGVASTVYEANTAGIGGRMHSDRSGYWSNHQVSEFCGELIDTGHETILALADRFGLTASDLLAAQPKGTDDTYYFLGDFYSTSQADKDFRPVHQRAAEAQSDAAGYPTTWDSYTPTGRMLDHMSVYDWIETYVPGGHRSPFGRLLDAAYAEEYGANTTDQASLNLVYLLAFQPVPGHLSIFGESDERFHIAGGNQQLPEAIAASLPSGTVKQGWTMQAIRTNRDGSVSMQFATPGRNADGHRRPGDPLHELRRAAHARLLGRGLRPAQADGDHAARRRPQREAPAPVQQPALERAGLDRRARTPTSASRTRGTSRARRRARRESSSTTRAATTRRATRRRRRTRTPARTRRWRRTHGSSSRKPRRSSPGSRGSGTERRLCRRRSAIRC